MTDVREIVSEYLVSNGYDGLVHADGIWDSCGCGLDDLAPCGDICHYCQPAYRVTWDTCPWRREEDHDCDASSRDDCLGCYTTRKPNEATDDR